MTPEDALELIAGDAADQFHANGMVWVREASAWLAGKYGQAVAEAGREKLVAMSKKAAADLKDSLKELHRSALTDDELVSYGKVVGSDLFVKVKKTIHPKVIDLVDSFSKFALGSADDIIKEIANNASEE